MKIYANETDESPCVNVWCCSISAPSQELRQIAKFILETADEMDAKQGSLNKYWHRHLDLGNRTLAVGFPDDETEYEHYVWRLVDNASNKKWITVERSKADVTENKNE